MNKWGEQTILIIYDVSVDAMKYQRCQLAEPGSTTGTLAIT